MICAIVLAAGESRRMGVQKVLLPFGGATVVEHIVEQLERGHVGRIFVVVGHESARVREALASRNVTVVENPDYAQGMLSSVRAGLRALPPECRGVLLALGDQPAVTPAIVDALIGAFAQNPKGIFVPACEGRRGHPLLFSVDYRDEILSRYDDTGLRGLLRAHPADIFELAVSDSAVLSDMDYPEDYRRELAKWEGKRES